PLLQHDLRVDALAARRGDREPGNPNAGADDDAGGAGDRRKAGGDTASRRRREDRGRGGGGLAQALDAGGPRTGASDGDRRAARGGGGDGSSDIRSGADLRVRPGARPPARARRGVLAPAARSAALRLSFGTVPGRN